MEYILARWVPCSKDFHRCRGEGGDPGTVAVSIWRRSGVRLGGEVIACLVCIHCRVSGYYIGRIVKRCRLKPVYGVMEDDNMWTCLRWS
jgi:hypothetical protein